MPAYTLALVGRRGAPRPKLDLRPSRRGGLVYCVHLHPPWPSWAGEGRPALSLALDLLGVAALLTAYTYTLSLVYMLLPYQSPKLSAKSEVIRVNLRSHHRQRTSPTLDLNLAWACIDAEPCVIFLAGRGVLGPCAEF